MDKILEKVIDIGAANAERISKVEEKVNKIKSKLDLLIEMLGTHTRSPQGFLCSTFNANTPSPTPPFHEAKKEEAGKKWKQNLVPKEDLDMKKPKLEVSKVGSETSY